MKELTQQQSLRLWKVNAIPNFLHPDLIDEWARSPWKIGIADRWAKEIVRTSRPNLPLWSFFVTNNNPYLLLTTVMKDTLLTICLQNQLRYYRHRKIKPRINGYHPDCRVHPDPTPILDMDQGHRKWTFEELQHFFSLHLHLFSQLRFWVICLIFDYGFGIVSIPSD